MRLSSNFAGNANIIRSTYALSDDQIARVAPSIFADGKHESRSDRYTYISTGDVLKALRTEGFQPFMACQTRVRLEGKKEHTKHMLRLRHADMITGSEADEIILLNSHDGTSSYQMVAGQFRFVCSNGLVVGDCVEDLRIPHKGDVIGRVIEGAFTVLDTFETVREQKELMNGVILSRDEQRVFADAALTLRYDSDDKAPITGEKLLQPRRYEDRKDDLWTTFNRVQENLIAGGLTGRNAAGKRTTTRSVTSMDKDMKLNRALWTLAEGMRSLKA